MAQTSRPPSLPSVADAGELINASGNDWRAILIAVMFLFVSMIVFVVWREILGWKMAKSLDKVSEALVALRIVVAEENVRQDVQDRRQVRQDRRNIQQDARQSEQDAREVDLDDRETSR